jgi:hypothetical protein
MEPPIVGLIVGLKASSYSLNPAPLPAVPQVTAQ